MVSYLKLYSLSVTTAILFCSGGLQSIDTMFDEHNSSTSFLWGAPWLSSRRHHWWRQTSYWVQLYRDTCHTCRSSKQNIQLDWEARESSANISINTICVGINTINSLKEIYRELSHGEPFLCVNLRTAYNFVTLWSWLICNGPRQSSSGNAVWCTITLTHLYSLCMIS